MNLTQSATTQSDLHGSTNLHRLEQAPAADSNRNTETHTDSATRPIQTHAKSTHDADSTLIPELKPSQHTSETQPIQTNSETHASRFKPTLKPTPIQPTFETQPIQPNQKQQRKKIERKGRVRDEREKTTGKEENFIFHDAFAAYPFNTINQEKSKHTLFRSVF